MNKKIDWRKTRHTGKRKVSIVDEEEWRNNDRAARWLARTEVDVRGSKPKQKTRK